MVGGLKGRTIGLLGLAFKPNTDDMRDAPSIDIAEALNKAGATVRGTIPLQWKLLVRFCRRLSSLMTHTNWQKAAMR